MKIVLALLAGAAVFFIYKKVKAAQLAAGPVGPSPSPLPSGGGSNVSPQLPAASGGGSMSEVVPGYQGLVGGQVANVTGEDFSNE